MELVWMGIGFGIITASVLALASVGLTLQFGVTNFVNFAYGEFLTIGAYIAYFGNSTLHLNIWLSMIIAALCTALISLGISKIVFQPFIKRKSPLLILLVVSIGLSLFLENGVQAVFGPSFQQYTSSQGSIFNFGAMIFTSQQLVIIAIALILMIFVHFLLRYTKIGKAMRAISDDPDLARTSGVPVRRITDFTWLLSGFLAGLAGVVLAINVNSFTPALGSEFLFIIFAAVILGGIGKPYGSMLGALIIGLVTEVSASFIDSAYKTVIAFFILVLVLLFRPQGILQSRGRA